VDVERKLTEFTKAIIPVSIFGLSPDYDPILSLARKHKLTVIEDNAQCYLATYKGKLYGAGFTPDVSILVWNKDLFKQAGLDPDKPPRTIGEIHEDAKKIRALGPDIYGYYFSGACPGCNIFVTSPMMVAAGSKILPANGADDALTGDGVKQVLETFKEMWSEGLISKNAQADSGANFASVFKTGKIGIQGTGGFLLSELKHDVPNMNFGVTFLPGAVWETIRRSCRMSLTFCPLNSVTKSASLNPAFPAGDAGSTVVTSAPFMLGRLNCLASSSVMSGCSHRPR